MVAPLKKAGALMETSRGNAVRKDEFNPLERGVFDRPAHDAIAKRAYELYLRRGARPGHAVEDWLRAERELVQGRN
jgi:hypothetical protein